MGHAEGGKKIFGYRIGILMLEADFPRIPGDIGNAQTFDFPVLYKVVHISPEEVVVRLKDSDVSIFIEAAKELEKDGVQVIFTGCGFLAMFQDQIKDALSIPFIASNLMMIPFVRRMLPAGKEVGVMTVNSATLQRRHFAGVGAEDVPKIVYGLQTEQEFTTMILENWTTMDPDRCREEHIKVASRMLEEHPEVGAIVLECTNMPPYAADIQKAVRVPVFDICSLIRYMHDVLSQTPYTGYAWDK